MRSNRGARAVEQKKLNSGDRISQLCNGDNGRANVEVRMVWIPKSDKQLCTRGRLVQAWARHAAPCTGVKKHCIVAMGAVGAEAALGAIT